MHLNVFQEKKKKLKLEHMYSQFATNSSRGKFTDLDQITDWIYYLTFVQEWKKRSAGYFLSFLFLNQALEVIYVRASVCFYSFVCRSATATNKPSPGFPELDFSGETKISFPPLFWSGAGAHFTSSLSVITQIDRLSGFWVPAQIVTMHTSMQQPLQYANYSSSPRTICAESDLFHYGFLYSIQLFILSSGNSPYKHVYLNISPDLYVQVAARGENVCTMYRNNVIYNFY